MNKTALITGASSGIGLELANVFALHGHDVVLVARSTEKLNELRDTLQTKYKVAVKVIIKDLSQLTACDEIYNELKRENRQIDYLVNNAGFGDYGLFHQTDWNKESMMIDLNIKSLAYLTKLFVKDMVQRRSGKILNVASTASFQPVPTMAIYSATKAFVLSFSEAITTELEGTGVTVTALCPGPTESGFQKAASMEDSKLFSGSHVATSAEVAQYGYEALMHGKVVAVHGVLNKVMAASAQLAPRAWVRKIARRMQGK